MISRRAGFLGPHAAFCTSTFFSSSNIYTTQSTKPSLSIQLAAMSQAISSMVDCPYNDTVKAFRIFSARYFCCNLVYHRYNTKTTTNATSEINQAVFQNGGITHNCKLVSPFMILSWFF